ncbi:MAG: DNA repair protein RecO [Candidatus Margulisiibacteriota bacterium]
MKSVQFEGVVFTAKPLFDHDRLVEIFSPTLGKVKVLAKSAQKKSLQFGGRLEPGAHIALTCTQGRSFLYLSDATPKSLFTAIRADFNKISLMGYFFDIIRKATVFDQHNEDLFALLIRTLAALNTERELDHIKAAFHGEFLWIEGLLETPERWVSDHDFKRAFEGYTGQPLRLPMVLK